MLFFYVKKHFGRILFSILFFSHKMIPKGGCLESIMRICELRKKEVINLCNGSRIGFVVDLEFDLKRGCIEAIIVPGPCKCFGILGHEKEYVIPYGCIKNIGPDVILVEICEEECLKKARFC